MNPAARRTLLLVLGFLAFAAVYNGLVMSPVLEQMAREFGITTGTAGLVVAAYGAPGIAVALLAGPYSDRIGRKGGKAVSEKYGPGHFERIGRRGGQKVASLVERAKTLESEDDHEKPAPEVRPEESIGA